MSSEKRKLVQKYLDKEMSKEEITAFEEELKVNPDLYEELLFHKEVDNAIKELIEENMFLKNLEKAHSSYLKTMAKGGKTNIFNRKFAFMPKENRPKTKSIVWYAAAAAVTILIIGTGIFFALQSGNNSPDRLYAEYKIPYEVSGIQRSGKNNGEDLYLTALALFEQKDYNASIANFDKLIAQGNAKSSVYYYKGLALLETDNAKEAVKNLQKTAADSQSELQQEAEWFLGLAYLKAGDVQNAKKQFTHIEEHYPYYKEKAGEILKKLKNQ